MGLATVYWLETPGPCAPGLNLACLRVKIVPPRHALQVPWTYQFTDWAA